MLRRLLRFLRLFASDPPHPSRPRPSRRPAAKALPFRDHERRYCPHCGMLLGAVAVRRGVCPRCRTTFPPVPATRP